MEGVLEVEITVKISVGEEVAITVRVVGTITIKVQCIILEILILGLTINQCITNTMVDMVVAAEEVTVVTVVEATVMIGGRNNYT